MLGIRRCRKEYEDTATYSSPSCNHWAVEMAWHSTTLPADTRVPYFIYGMFRRASAEHRKGSPLRALAIMLDDHEESGSASLVLLTHPQSRAARLHK
jgi:hypothetical protein